MSDQALVAEHPHPLVEQLSALHHFRIYADIAVVVVVLALTNLIAHFTTPWASFATVPAAAVGLLLLVRSRGLGWAELGLGREHWKSGAGYALAAVALVMSVIAIGALLPWTRPMFMNNNYATISGALIASMIDHSAANGDSRGVGVPRGAARCAEPGVGLPRRRGGGLAAVRPLAYRHLIRPDQQQRRLHPAIRRRTARHHGRRGAGGGRDRGSPVSCSPGCGGAAAA